VSQRTVSLRGLIWWASAAAAVCAALASPRAAQAGDASLKYDIVVDPMAEVCLEGAGELTFWTTTLEKEGLHPTVEDGHAVLMLCANSGRFGLKFQEVIYTIFTSNEPGGSSRDGGFLIYGLNSRKAYARVERKRNQSPYEHGEVVQKIEGSVAAIGGTTEDGWYVTATLSGELEPISKGEKLWQGPVHLPRAMTPEGEADEVFDVRLSGVAETYTFAPESDTFSTGGDASVSPLLNPVVFEPKLWLVRPVGVHAKTNNRPR